MIPCALQRSIGRGQQGDIMKHLYLIGGGDTVAADSPEEAADCWLDVSGETAVDYSDLEVEPIPGDSDIKIWFDYDPKNFSLVPQVARYTEDEDWWYITASAEAWAGVIPDPEILCSTEF